MDTSLCFFFFHLCYDLFINIILCSEMSVQYYLKYCKTGSHIQYIITTYQINSQYPYYINFPYSYFFVTVISGKSSALKQCTNLGCSCELPECIMYQMYVGHDICKYKHYDLCLINVQHCVLVHVKTIRVFLFWYCSLMLFTVMLFGYAV